MTTTDIFPNYMSGLLTLSAANTFSTQTKELPVNRLRVAGGEATVIEFLWVDIALNTVDFIATADDYVLSVQTGTTPTLVGTFNNPDVLAFFNQEAHFLTSGGFFTDNVRRFDFQSQDGHGLLVAADRVHISANTAGMAAATGFAWRIYYRFVSVPVEEFVGIVQSQS